MNYEIPFSVAVGQRCSARGFEASPIDERDLQRILCAGLAAPSSYNLQPWRFVVVRTPEQKARLREAAMGQSKVEEAPVVIVACGDLHGWRNGDLEAMLSMEAERGVSAERIDQVRKNVSDLLANPGLAGAIAPDISVWINRNVMIALCTMMWMAETLGYSTIPMEGFWEDKVKAVLDVPESVRIVALLALGRAKESGHPRTSRFDSSKLLYSERWSAAFSLQSGDGSNRDKPRAG